MQELLDSTGVHISAFDGSNPKFAKRFRVFTDHNFREIVARRLLDQLVGEGFARPGPAVEFWLVAGHIANACKETVPAHFAAHGWELRDRGWIKAALQDVATEGYEDDVVTMAAKLLAD